MKTTALITPDYEVDQDGLLFFCPRSTPADDRTGMMRLVIPEQLQRDFLHHFHTSVEGGRQEIDRTYQRIRTSFQWIGPYRSVQRFIGKCTYCKIGKGTSTVDGTSAGNVQASYPFQIIAMDHIPSQLGSFKGNTELLLWVDLFLVRYR